MKIMSDITLAKTICCKRKCEFSLYLHNHNPVRTHYDIMIGRRGGQDGVGLFVILGWETVRKIVFLMDSKRDLTNKMQT